MPETALEQIARDIAERARRAVEGGTPLVLLLFYQHEAEKLSLLGRVRIALQNLGLKHQTLDPAHRPDHGTGRLYDTLAAVGRDTISLVPDLPHRSDAPGLDPEFLLYFNLHRDRIPKDKLRFVLCLHESDAEQFMLEAGDLWDFRHHTYWLERTVSTRGQELWRDVEQLAKKLPLPETDRLHIEEHVKRVRGLVEETTEAADKAALLLDLSQWLRRRHAPALAAEVALEGLGAAPEEAKQTRADLEHALAYALRQSTRPSEALIHYEASLALAREIGDRVGEAATLNNISQIYHDWGRYEEALRNLEQSLAIRREVGDRAGEAVTLNNISQIYDAWGRYDDALHTLEEVLAIRREIGDRAGEAVTLNNISQIYDVWGRYDEALHTLEESLAISREIADRAGEAVTLNNISQIYRAWGRNDDALRMLEQSLAIRREVGDRAGEAVTLNNISQIYSAWGRNDYALRMLEQSLAIRREVGDRAGEAVTLNNISQIYDTWGRYDEALHTLEESLAISREIGDRAGEAVTLNNISQIYDTWGRYDDVLRTLEESLAIYREVGDLAGEAVTAWNLGREYERRGELEKAIPLVRRTVEIDFATNHPDLEKDRAFLQKLEERLKEERRRGAAVVQ